MNNRIQRGNVAELIVSAEASKRDYVVCLPISHNSHYDLILDKDNSLYRCQIKRAFLVKDARMKKELWAVEGRRISGGNRYSYPENSYDYLVACDVENMKFWFIPKKVADIYKSMIYLGEKLEKYKEQWI